MSELKRVERDGKRPVVQRHFAAAMNPTVIANRHLPELIRLGKPSDHPNDFIDITGLPPDFRSLQERFGAIRERFEALPVQIRERFNYDPLKMIDFLRDPENQKEALKLGLIEAVPQPGPKAEDLLQEIAKNTKREPSPAAPKGSP